MFALRRPEQFSLNATLIIAAGILLLTAGCQSGPRYAVANDVDQRVMAKAQLPDYAPGEYFVFDDGSAVLVSEVSDGLVTWRHENGVISKGYPNFIIPDLSWTSANRFSEARTTAPPDLLWPLAAGKRGTFDFEQAIASNDGSAPTQLVRRWTCTVEGTERVSVAAGSFDTVVIACNRYSDAGSWRATRRFYYAPDLGYYVLREDRHHRRTDTRRELVNHGFNSTVLSKRDQIVLNKKLQATLTENKDGQASFWRNQKGDLAAMLVPVRSYPGTNGQSCRAYRSIYSVSGRIHENDRDVCRQSQGNWQRIK